MLWDPFLMKKLLKSGICGSMNSTLMHCLLRKSQHLRLLFIEQYMNSNRVTPKRVKKKKKKGTKTQTWVQWIQTYTKWWVVINDRPHKGASLVRTIVSALTSNTNFAFNGEWRTNMLLLPSSSRGCMTVNYKH